MRYGTKLTRRYNIEQILATSQIDPVTCIHELIALTSSGHSASKNGYFSRT